MTGSKVRPTLPESVKTRWGIGRSMEQGAELQAVMRMRLVVHPVVNELTDDDSFVVWDYLDQLPRDDVTELVSVLVSGSGGSVSAAGLLLLRLARFHQKSFAPAARQVAPLVIANGQRQSLRDSAIEWVTCEVGLTYKRDYVGALMKKYGIKNSRAEAWLKYAIDAGVFTPTDSYSKGGRPKK